MPRSVAYILAFAAAVCVACGILVSTAAVTLQGRQKVNAELEKKTNVLLAAGLAEEGESLSPDDVDARFEVVRPTVITLSSGEKASEIDPDTYDQQKAKTDSTTSSAAPPNPARIKRIPHHA